MAPSPILTNTSWLELKITRKMKLILHLIVDSTSPSRKNINLKAKATKNHSKKGPIATITPIRTATFNSPKPTSMKPNPESPFNSKYKPKANHSGSGMLRLHLPSNLPPLLPLFSLNTQRPPLPSDSPNNMAVIGNFKLFHLQVGLYLGTLHTFPTRFPLIIIIIHSDLSCNSFRCKLFNLLPSIMNLEWVSGRKWSHSLLQWGKTW